MATIDLGKISFVWKGAYAGGTAYTTKDVVSYNGASYICKLASTGNLPTNATYWDLMSVAGVDGTDVGTTITTQGDVLYRDGSGVARLAAGTSGQFLKTQGAGQNPVWAEAAYDDNKMQSNIALLGFKCAVNGSLAKYNLVDQIIDEYTDATGVDASASTDENLSAGGYSSIIPGGNYFGTGADGDVTISSSTDLTVSNTQGSYDGDMVFKQYSSLTVNAGQTLSTNGPCRGMFIYVTGNCTINGTISMTGKGAYANPANTSGPSWGSAGSDGNTLGADGLQLGLVKSGNSETLTNNGAGFNGCGTAVRTAVALQDNIASNGKIYKITRTSTAAGAARTSTQTAGDDASSGQSVFSTGGGGSGAATSTQPSGAGATGTCWSGGAGGGGVHSSSGGGRDATAYGGPGGGGNFGGNAGGAGNPGGSGNSGNGGNGETGTGGTIWLIVGGTLSGSGTIVSNGKNGGAFVNNSCAGGGGSGGGAIIVVAATDSSSITLTATGGTGTVTGSSGGSQDGGDGGAGYTLKEGGINGVGSTASAMTLQSTANTASSAATKADLIMLMENAYGTATINVDIKGYVTADGGSNWTEGTLVDEGSWGTNKKIYAFHDATVTSGTDMRYKITTHNQVASSKETKIHATSIGWA